MEAMTRSASPSNIRTGLFAFVLLVLFCMSSQAQPYSIDWYRIAGGGGTSTGGTYTVSGTIGQHDANSLATNANVSLVSGFWALYAVETPGAPTLSIKLTTTNTAMVYWPSPSPGWTLQAATNFPTTNWSTPVELVNDNGTNKYIIINSPGHRFFRLRNP